MQNAISDVFLESVDVLIKGALRGFVFLLKVFKYAMAGVGLIVLLALGFLFWSSNKLNIALNGRSGPRRPQ